VQAVTLHRLIRAAWLVAALLLAAAVVAHGLRDGFEPDCSKFFEGRWVA
jgi:hypothetical protein